MTMIPEGERCQASLGGNVGETPAWLMAALRGVSAQQVKVTAVDYAGARVEVYNSMGTRWARVLKSKSSGTMSGEIDMPNVDDIGLITGTNGDECSPVWLGALTSIEPKRALENDSNFTSVADLVHRKYSKHETGSFTLLDRLGNFMARLKKRASTEADPGKKSLDVSVTKDGVVTITHYRGSELASAVISSDQSGNVTVKNFKDDGSTVAFKMTMDKNGSGILTDGAGSTITMDATASSVKVLTPSGAGVTVNNPTDSVLVYAQNVHVNGGTVTLSDGATKYPICTSEMLNTLNLLITAVVSHVHPLDIPHGLTLVSPGLAAFTPIPVSFPNVTAQVTGA